MYNRIVYLYNNDDNKIIYIYILPVNGCFIQYNLGLMYALCNYLNLFKVYERSTFRYRLFRRYCGGKVISTNRLIRLAEVW